jgi:peptide/nickel transport system substrate-binding protein
MRHSRALVGASAGLAAALAIAACSNTTPASSGGSTSASATSAASSSAPALLAGASSTATASVEPFQTGHKGGSLKLLATAAAGTIDPQVNYTLQYWQLYRAVYDGLMAFKAVSGQPSFETTPDLAAAEPVITNGGKTYTFTLRKGITFSNGHVLDTADVVASFQRIFKVSSPTAGSFYNGIVGATACLKTPKTCTLAGGISADAAKDTVTINLTAADPEFLFKLAVPHATITPVGSPTTDVGDTPLPSTGAYMISKYDPSGNGELVLSRNPHFKQWSALAQPQGYPDTITESFGQTVDNEVTEVENGQADWIADSIPTGRLNELGTKYADQVHVNTLTAMYYLPLNVNLAPFNNLKARQALNWAIDKNAVVKLYGGTNLATPVCTVLPPGFPGHVDNCQYTKGGGTTWTAPDLTKAKALVKESGTAGQQVTVITTTDPVGASIGEYVQSVLNSIGYKAQVRKLSSNIQFTYIQNTKNKVQLSLSQWYQDYPAASDFLNVLYSCADFHPGSDSSINISGFCDKTNEALMAKALSVERTQGLDAASPYWAKSDQRVMAEAAEVPLFTPRLVDFTSKRVGNYTFSKQFYLLLDQLWVQ